MREELQVAKRRLKELELKKDELVLSSKIADLDKIISASTKKNIDLIKLNTELKRKLQEQERPPILIQGRRVQREQSKIMKRLQATVLEAEKTKAEVSNTIKERARKAGRSKVSPYVKTGTKEAVKLYWLTAKDSFTIRGNQAKFIRDMQDKSYSGILPTPPNSALTDKTLKAWFKEFEEEENNKLLQEINVQD